MKKSTKLMSLLLAGITLASAMTVSASASTIFTGNIGCGTACTCDDCKEEDKNIIIPIGSVVNKSSKIFKTVTVLEPASYKGDESNPATVYVGKEVVVKTPVCTTPVVKPSYNYDCYGTLYGYKYFDKVNAKEWIENYFEDNSYRLELYEGEVREFNPDIYYFSEDPDVAYYDYKEGKIVANSRGQTNFYVYTNGGVPLYRLNVNVSKIYRLSNNVPDQLVVDAAKWNVQIGDEFEFTVKSVSGKTYSDIIFEIREGSAKADLTQTTGKFTAKKNGVVIVRAYSKSNPNVYGEMLVYIGSYTSAILDGCYTKYDDCISVNGWFDGCFTSGNYYTVMGWVKGDDGTLIPVIAKKNAMIPTLNSGYVSYLDIFRKLYGSKNDICDILEKYNEIKYGKYCDKVICDEYDYRNFFFANTLEDLIGK